MLIVTPQIRIPLGELEFTFARSGGPGGQNVNKVNSKATLRWHASASPSLPEDVRERFVKKYGHRLTTDGELLITSQRFRDAGRNTADCLEKLRGMIADVAVAPKTRRPSRRTRGSVERRLQGKRCRSQSKQRRRIEGE
jgi:ribosome-associated protein